MLATVHRFNDAIVTVYYLGRGEKIDWHVHPFEHTTSCSRGRTIVRVEGDPPRIMTPKDGDFILPAKRRHEVEGAEDDTIAIHISGANNTTDLAHGWDNSRRPGYIPGKPNPVLMDDGTVQYRDD
jgi:quercetin dioxygenase-like cupin family protein